MSERPKCELCEAPSYTIAGRNLCKPHYLAALGDPSASPSSGKAAEPSERLARDLKTLLNYRSPRRASNGSTTGSARQ